MRSIIRMMTALAVAAAFVFSTSAADVKVGKGSGIVAVPGESALMTCSHCKTDYVVKLTKSSKGTEPEKAVLGKHQCQMCSTKLTTRGVGKAKTEVAEHTCKNCSK